MRLLGNGLFCLNENHPPEQFVSLIEGMFGPAQAKKSKRTASSRSSTSEQQSKGDKVLYKVCNAILMVLTVAILRTTHIDSIWSHKIHSAPTDTLCAIRTDTTVICPRCSDGMTQHNKPTNSGLQVWSLEGMGTMFLEPHSQHSQNGRVYTDACTASLPGY